MVSPFPTGTLTRQDAPSLSWRCNAQSELKTLLGEDTFDNAVWKLAKARFPRFFYFADYSKLPYSAKIHHVLKAGDDQLSESEATARALRRAALGVGRDENPHLGQPALALTAL